MTSHTVSGTNMDKPHNLKCILEAFLLVCDEPCSAEQFARVLQQEEAEVEHALTELAQSYQEEHRGFALRCTQKGWRLYTNPRLHSYVEQFLAAQDTRKLSQAALEVLSIVAYLQPVGKDRIRAIRGVTSDAAISSLKQKGLIYETHRKDHATNAILYATTKDFLDQFGLKSIQNLPPVEDFAANEEAKSYIRSRLAQEPLSFITDEQQEDTLTDYNETI